MKQNIIVVDDFYSNPQEVRDFALKAEYPEPTDDYTYPGRNSEGVYYSQDIQTLYKFDFVSMKTSCQSFFF